MSLVEVSPSTLIMLNESFTSALSARRSISGLMAASVVKNTSMVAMFGWIMPEPLAMPPSVHVRPPTSNATATSFFARSVVMIASAASPLPPRESAAASAGMAASMGAGSSGWPITPVEATITSEASMPSACAAAAHMRPATCSPPALQVLALPLLHTIACAKPFCRCARVTAIGAPLTRFCV